MILSLAYCYHARLPRAERRQLVDRIVEAYRHASEPQGGRGRGQYAAMYGAYGGYGGRGGGGGGGQQGGRCRWLALEAQAFQAVLEQTQREFVGKMNLEEGIALNEALCENLFMIMVSILNQIPIFVIGACSSRTHTCQSVNQPASVAWLTQTLSVQASLARPRAWPWVWCSPT